MYERLRKGNGEHIYETLHILQSLTLLCSSECFIRISKAAPFYDGFFTNHLKYVCSVLHRVDMMNNRFRKEIMKNASESKLSKDKLQKRLKEE